MADGIVQFDYTGTPGQRFPSQTVRDEIAGLAPIPAVPEQITTDGIGDRQVTGDKLDLGTMQGENIADQAVGNDQLEDAAVSGDKAGTGVMRVVNSAGQYIDMRVMILTSAEFAAITAKDPNTAYWVQDL
jgi:hypothetical protein